MDNRSKSLFGNIFSDLKEITDDLVSDNKTTAFGDLISSQLTQVGIISKTYESEILDLTNKMEKVLGVFEDKIAGHEADKENLETEIANLKKQKVDPGLKNAKKDKKGKK